MSSTEKMPPVHDDDCTYKDTGYYVVGCVGCVHQLIIDSEKALKLDYHDNLNETDNEKKKIMEEKIAVFIFLKGMFP